MGPLMGAHPLAWWEALFLASGIGYLVIHLALAAAHVPPDLFFGALWRSLGLG